MQCFLPGSSLFTIYKSFIRPHLDYRDVIYDQPSYATSSSEIGSVQHMQVSLEARVMKNSTKN